MFLTKSTFLEEEKHAPLLNMNLNDHLKNVIQPNMDKYAEKWKSLLLTNYNLPNTENQLLPTPRIIYLDAERTFVQEHHKKQLIDFLTRAYSNLKGDYSQAMAYVAGFLLLILDEQTTMSMMVRLDTDPKYVPGYWKDEPVAAATDAYVFNHLVQRYFPQVAQHLAKLYVFPENFCQKWFGGLCIQIMPFETLYPFFDLFFEHGFKFLFQFGLSLIDNLKEELLKISDPSDVFAFLRLDQKFVSVSSSPLPNRKTINPNQLLQHALEFDISDVDFPKLRKELFEKHLKERLERAKEFEKKHKEEEDNDDDEDEEGEDCDVCHDMLPEYTCTVCNLNVCEKCHKGGKGSHKKNHKVKPYESKDKSDEEVDALTNQLKEKIKVEDDKEEY